MNIPNLKYYNNHRKIINLTANNSTPTKIKKFSYSNFKTSKNKTNCRNRNDLIDSFNKNFSYNNINSNNSKKYIFKNYKVSPLIALLIYEKVVNKLFEYIEKCLPKNIFIEFKKKYIKFVIEELHIEKNILSNISEQDLINSDIKLFISKDNSYFLNYRKFNNKNNINSNSKSFFQINKNTLKRGKISSFNSFNTEVKNTDKSLINSSKIFLRTKNKTNNICNTEYNNKNEKEKIKPKKLNIKEISKFNVPKNKRKEVMEHLKNYSLVNNTNQLILSQKNLNLKEKIINNGKNVEKIYKKLPINKTNKIIREKIKEEIKKEENEKNKKILETKENEKNSIKQLNIIKENLDDNLKNIFNFSYGYFLNYERESDSSKSINDLYKFNNYDYNNLKQN